uniref:Zinc finger GATA like protein 1 n=1 Tax=Seriola lalandi dorsalis TaxID=1841481 RepID=A0A3B4YLR8_SERLL
MSTGQKKQAAFIQGSQSTADQESSHSALFYLFQEVSRLGSPVHNSFLDTNSPSKWLNETSRRDNFIVRNEEDSAHLFQSFNNSCQHSLSHKLPYNQVNKVKEESHSSNITTLAESHYECNSPWKVLSLINLQCERLLHRRDVEESDPGSGPSTAKLGHLTAKSTTAAADVKEQGVRSDSVNVEYTLRPSLLICKRQEITASVSHVEDMRGVCKLRPMQREELSLASSQQWRTKTPRKQPHPSRSVDIQDPDFQGMYYIFDKVCASCCTRKTPMWRDAEDGTPLCNACGIRYKKYRVRCVNCWHIPRKEGNSNSCCLKCGNLVSGWPHTD